METTFSANSVHDFLKDIIEIGGVHYVDDQQCIRYTADDSPVGVRLNNGKDGKKVIALYKENMEMDPIKVILNPFVDLLGKFPEKDWFFGYVSVLPGALIKETIKGMCNVALSDDKDTGFKAAKTMSKFIDRIDSKFLAEVEKLRGVDIGVILYNQEKHVAQLISALWEPEFEANNKTKLRKSSLMLLKEMIATLLDVKDPAELVYTATLIGCPQMDAMIHVLAEALDKISDPFEHFTGTKIKVAEIKEHLNHLEAYHKAMQWLTSSAVSPMKEKPSGVTSVSEIKETPWTVAAPGMFTPPAPAGGQVTVLSGGLAERPKSGFSRGGDSDNEERASVSAALASTGGMGGARIALPTFRTPVPTTMPGAVPTMPMYGMPTYGIVPGSLPGVGAYAPPVPGYGYRTQIAPTVPMGVPIAPLAM